MGSVSILSYRCLCSSCGSSQCCILHDLQFVNADRGLLEHFHVLFIYHSEN